ncbi:MAG: lipocalin family protein [Cyclobacteriaceae bacterium]
MNNINIANTLVGMKPISFFKYKSGIACLAFFVLLLTGWDLHAQSSEDLLLGVWELDYKASVQGMSSKQKIKYEKFDSSTKQRAEVFFDKRKFIFLNEGIYKLLAAQEGSLEGSYSRSGNKISMTVGGGEKVSYEIEELSENRLVLRTVSQYADDAILKDLHFKRIEQ